MNPVTILLDHEFDDYTVHLEHAPSTREMMNRAKEFKVVVTMRSRIALSHERLRALGNDEEIERYLRGEIEMLMRDASE